MLVAFTTLLVAVSSPDSVVVLNPHWRLRLRFSFWRLNSVNWSRFWIKGFFSPSSDHDGCNWLCFPSVVQGPPAVPLHRQLLVASSDFPHCWRVCPATRLRLQVCWWVPVGYTTPNMYLTSLPFGQRSSPWSCNSVKVVLTFHLECKICFSCAQFMSRQMHWTNLPASIKAKYWFLDERSWRQAMKAPSFCAVTADSKSRWPLCRNAYFCLHWRLGTQLLIIHCTNQLANSYVVTTNQHLVIPHLPTTDYLLTNDHPPEMIIQMCCSSPPGSP